MIKNRFKLSTPQALNQFLQSPYAHSIRPLGRTYLSLLNSQPATSTHPFWSIDDVNKEIMSGAGSFPLQQAPSWRPFRLI